jgi:single-strand selective monofunctional uracil DNA glycosylase
MRPLQPLVDAANDLNAALRPLRFADPVHTVYNPLEYAAAPHLAYLERYGTGTARVVFLGMNPGPFGMGQTGVPFGDPELVRDFLQVTGPVLQPERVHPKRPIIGCEATRSEVSGRRLWSAIRDHWPSADAFFESHYVANYCPLAFMEEGGRNRTPDKLPREERDPLFAACDLHLRRVVEALQSEWVIGVGRFAEKRALSALAGTDIRIGSVLHPSPASPAANRDWIGQVTAQLQEMGICSSR